MSGGREQILGNLRRSLGRTGEDEEARAAVAARLDSPARGTIPARARISHVEQVDLFDSMAREQAATVVHVASAAEIPAAITEYLKAGNLPPKLRMAPHPELEALPWDSQPLIEVETGAARGDDQVSVTAAFAGIAETGTLLLTSGPQGPTTLNFLPETHIVVLKASQVVGAYEDAWDRVRAAYGRDVLPRTVNFITGPSRTADIEQTIQLGAHGPRRLHIVLIEDGGADGS
ncbi:MAG: lactate utilization protein C [Kiloniellales bacterium]